ncbi:sensor histidine kinase [Streptomyces sp. NPDC001401]|uniref:sensor histidine kinase n=1 Tax=Streptomyces sp. NPDC001401 TaxID=3364570 RepID=UPI0036B0FCC0
MDVGDILLLALAGFWAPVLILTFLWSYFKQIEIRRTKYVEFEQREIRERSDRDNRRLEMALGEILDRIERQQHLFTSIQSDFTQEVRHLAGSEIREAIQTSLSHLTNELRTVRQPLSPELGSNLIGELAHSLKTPLAHIEVTIREWAKSTTSAAEVEEIHDVLTSVELCKASLAAFRELRQVSSAADSWSPTSLSESVQGAVSVYSARAGKRSTLELSLPDSIPEYSNNYLLALMLPLIENAVEASPDGEKIQLRFNREVGNRIVFSLENSVDAPVDGEILHTAGLTTKLGHDGLGVATVKDLLTAYDGAELVDSSRGNRFTMTIYLPGK